MLFFGIFIIFVHGTTLKKTRLKKNCLKKEYYYYYDDDDVIRKCSFYRSLFGNFYRADDHWEVTLVFISAAPYRCISK